MSLVRNRLVGYFDRWDGSQRQGCLVSSPRIGTLDAKALRMILPPDPRYPLGTYRPELVARVRRELSLGIYDTPEKLEAAIDRLLDHLEAVEDDSEPWRTP